MEGLAGYAFEGAVFWNVPCGLVPLHFFLASFLVHDPHPLGNSPTHGRFNFAPKFPAANNKQENCRTKKMSHIHVRGLRHKTIENKTG